MSRVEAFESDTLGSFVWLNRTGAGDRLGWSEQFHFQSITILCSARHLYRALAESGREEESRKLNTNVSDTRTPSTADPLGHDSERTSFQ